MAKQKNSPTGSTKMELKPKCTSIGRSRNTNLAATPTRGKKRRYRGQGT